MTDELSKQLHERLLETGFPTIGLQPPELKGYFTNLVDQLLKGKLLIARPAYNADGTTGKVFEVR